LECVAVQVALGPHWESVEQSPHVPPEQISPAGHWLLAVQPLGGVVPEQLPPGQARHAWYDWQEPPVAGFAQYWPSWHAELDVHEPLPPKGKNGNGFATAVHCCPEGHDVHWEHEPPAHVSHAGQSASELHALPQKPPPVPGKRLHTLGDTQLWELVHATAPLGRPASYGGGGAASPIGPVPESEKGHGKLGGTHRTQLPGAEQQDTSPGGQPPPESTTPVPLLPPLDDDANPLLLADPPDEPVNPPLLADPPEVVNPPLADPPDELANPPPVLLAPTPPPEEADAVASSPPPPENPASSRVRSGGSSFVRPPHAGWASDMAAMESAAAERTVRAVSRRCTVWRMPAPLSARTVAPARVRAARRGDKSLLGRPAKAADSVILASGREHPSSVAPVRG
jgi:hypothetical protein